MNLPRWTTERAVEQFGESTPQALTAVIERIEHDLRPVPRDEAGAQAWRNALDERLRRLAAKVAPTMSPSQTQEWRAVMSDALSDLPAMVSLTACKRAIHQPFRFMGDIEHGVREIAAAIVVERESRRRAAERILADLQRAVAPPIALPDVDYDAPITDDQIRAMPAAIRRMGVKIGAITEEQLARAVPTSDEVEDAA